MASIDVENVFTVEPKSIWLFLMTDGQGYYIPPYQRPYSWDKQNVSRIFEDALQGINQLKTQPSTISFLGTIIVIHDSKYETISPMYQREVPTRVFTIIDGQQRLSTFTMMNVLFHNIINNYLAKIPKNDESFAWLRDQCLETRAFLEKSFVIDNTTGDGNYRYYPKIIRAYDDVWAKKRDHAKYKSPVAKLIWEYVEHYKNDTTCRQQFNYKLTDESLEHLPDSYKAVASAFKTMRQESKKICEGSSDSFPNLVDLSKNSSFMDAIWSYDLPDEVKEFICEKSDHKKYKLFENIFRYLVLIKYINERMAFTIVRPTTEDNAFDMFEALNTTGAPLTAFETFKPKVIEMEGLAHYKDSEAYKNIKVVEDYLDNFDSTDLKQKVTSEMLIPFALAASGERIQKKLNDQRRYLRSSFEKLKGDDKSEYVRFMANLARFMKYGWSCKDQTPLKSYAIDLDNEALIGFDLLRQLKHNITIAPLVRFFDKVLIEEDETKRKEYTKEFVSALKATVAFSTLWRGAKGGANNIDAHYRDLMNKGVGNLPPLALRTKAGVQGEVSLVSYKQALRDILKEKGGFSSKDDWVKEASKAPLYKQAKSIARFLLFCAYEDSEPDTQNLGLFKKGRKGIREVFTLENWKREDYLTVEHIAPQSNANHWDDRIYEEVKTVDLLGNLTLLPQATNSILGDRSWDEKREIYKMLSADSDEEFNKLLQGFTGSLSQSAKDTLKESRYLPLCKSISMLSTDWDIDMIHKRSKGITSLAWDKVYPWLEN